MTSLRLRMPEDMQIRNLAVNTQDRTFNRSHFSRATSTGHRTIGARHIRAYQVYLTKEKKLATEFDPHCHFRTSLSV